jgi:hypothetical protein
MAINTNKIWSDDRYAAYMREEYEKKAFKQERVIADMRVIAKDVARMLNGIRLCNDDMCISSVWQLEKVKKQIRELMIQLQVEIPPFVELLYSFPLFMRCKYSLIGSLYPNEYLVDVIQDECRDLKKVKHLDQILSICQSLQWYLNVCRDDTVELNNTDW